jgi:protein-S-isoprenylcysteine O-methyltransferase Ste14
MKLSNLVGSGSKIGLFSLPFIIIALFLNIISPSLFRLPELPPLLKGIFVLILIIGIINWIWSVGLILVNVPQNKLITTGPYSIVKHPLYTGVALLVLPALGFLFSSTLGLFIGLIVYFVSRLFSPSEEKVLAQTFGSSAWESFLHQLKLPWF